MASSIATPSRPDIESLLTEYYAAWGGTDEDRIMSYYADNVVVQFPGMLMQGKSAVREQFVRPFIAAFPGNRHVVKNMIFGRDVVVAEFSFDAEHKGTFAGREATHAHVQVTGCGVYEFDSAKRQITAARIYFDVPALLKQIADPRYPRLNIQERTPSPAPTIPAPVEHLDVETVIAVSQTVSGEMVLEKLLDTLMRTAVGHTGAERALLVLSREGEERIAAEATSAKGIVTVRLCDERVTGSVLPETVLRHVLHNRESVILDDAAAPNTFSVDPYIAQFRSRSIFCLPLMHQTECVGVLYLENTLAAGIFASARIAVLKLLASQAATALENSRLYRDVANREARIRRLWDSNILGICIWDLDGAVVSANEEFLRMLQYDQDDVASGRLCWTELTPHRWRAKTERAVAALRATGSFQPFEKEYYRKDGSRVSVLIGGALFEGSPNQGVAFVLDLTERKRAEQASRESEQRFRDYAETASDWFWEIGPDYRFTLLTENAFASDTKNRIGTLCWDNALDLETDAEKWQLVQDTLNARKPFRDFVYHGSGGNGPMYVKASGKPVFDANGNFTGYRGTGTDVTAIMRAQEAARESEERFRAAIDGIPGLVGILSPEGSVQAVNRRIIEYCGQPLEELKNWGTNGTVHAEDLPHVAEVFGRSIASGIPYQIEQRLRRFDGEYRWFDNRGVPFRDASGRVACWYILLTDIDDRKHAEDALSASERNLKLTIDTIPALVWSARPDGSAEFFSQNYLDYIGLSLAEAQDWGWAAAVHPEDLSALTLKWQAILASGQGGEAEARLRGFDGDYRWLLFRTNPLRDEEGNIVKWYGINTDIEDRKHAEEALRKREAELKRANQYLNVAQELSHTGSYARDVPTDDQALSDEMYRIMDFDPAKKVTHEMVLERIHPEDLPIFEGAQRVAMESGEDFKVAYRIVTGSGAVKHLRSSSRRLREITDRLVYIGATQDVTEIKLAEEALNTARGELAHVGRVMTLGALTASIAHEVNQPLSGIITNAGTCLRMLAADPPNVEGARTTAQRTLRDGNRASEIIQRLRAMFAHKERTAEPLDLNETAREVLALSSGELQRRGVILRTEFGDGLPEITGDRVQLQQVILNLVLNAADAMRGIDDRPRNLLVATARGGDGRVRLSVRDSGIGIDPQNAEKLFGAFYTTKSHGMGVGLAISRSIIEGHGGSIWATNNEGPGATFSFAVPTSLN